MVHGRAPKKQGLYDPANEKDACGIGLVVDIPGRRSHRTLRDAITILKNLHHRGAQAADGKSGDGCGILTQIPDRFFREMLSPLAISLPPAGSYGVGMIFLPRAERTRCEIERRVEIAAVDHDLEFLGWRDVPVHSAILGDEARRTEPFIRQFFVSSSRLKGNDLELQLYRLRRRIEKKAVAGMPEEALSEFAIPSLSSTRVVYKGLLIPDHLARFFPDLAHEAFETAIAMVHSRFSTNTFPSWPLAHPYRFLCHNGEINTLRGNLNSFRAREKFLRSSMIGADLEGLQPVIGTGQSDSASLDNLVELLVAGGRTLPHVMAMLIPEPWEHAEMSPARRDFYEYHATLQEPWDGPAALCWSDGVRVGANLDRNGLRPCRFLLTTDERLILSSEVGVLPLEPTEIKEKGRLAPGEMIFVDTSSARVYRNDEIKAELAARKPYGEWLKGHRRLLSDLIPPPAGAADSPERLLERQRLFGFTEEEMKYVLEPMAMKGEEPISSMGVDTPLAILSERPQLLFNYFKQLFAQVTNPPIDPIREDSVMSLTTFIGARGNLLAEEADACTSVRLAHPILSAAELAALRTDGSGIVSETLSMVFFADEDGAGLEKELDSLVRRATSAVRKGASLLVLTDREADAERVPMPSLFALSAVHQELQRAGLRPFVSLVVETGEVRDPHQLACLLGFGAAAVAPYVALESVEARAVDPASKEKYISALKKGLLKIFSKMGIATLSSYSGAQLFQALGLDRELMDRYFGGAAQSGIGGLSLQGLALESIRRHREAYGRGESDTLLDSGSALHYRAGGEHHDWNPGTISSLQQAVKTGDPKTFREFSEKMNHETNPVSLRGILEFAPAESPVPLASVEAAVELVKRFTTGAMSLGAISDEAHRTLAIAMNRIGAKSNTGEGGEDPDRFPLLPNGDSENSYIKQVASARFGVTIDYLVNAGELQIKIAQGAKPGEGGQLPGPKVGATIARLRHSTPGITLISPPPHHDIYSIEDLSQLIYDLRNANPEAVISVKLVAEAGVGVVAAGVAKAGADKILISGDSGGTGASPLTSIRHAGIPWEIGLAETHQTLLLNGLRSRVRLETDGQIRTGRDVAIAALLGADEFGFATAPLIVEGCVMMRKCHLNTCPVGIATQDPKLRAKFAGRPEHVVNYFFFVAEELRALMAELGFRSLNEMIGRTDLLRSRDMSAHWKAAKLDLSALLYRPDPERYPFRPRAPEYRAPLPKVLDQMLVDRVMPALEAGEWVSLNFPIRNSDRAVGTLLSGHLTRKFGSAELLEDAVVIRFRGSAGQSFGAFVRSGLGLRLEGEANDYVGKGLSGGKISIRPLRGSFDLERSILLGNTALYGATSGEAYFAGRAGERFAVRNSGASAVVEGVGAHGCEYMTGGTVVVLGEVGANFGAGMSGGVVYAYDPLGKFRARCNREVAGLDEGLEATDDAILRRLLERHYDLTGSSKAKRVLAAWDKERPSFRKLVPTAYREALMAATSRPPSQKMSEPEVSHV